MDRGSSKHGPQLDEQMEQEVRAHLQGSPAGARAEEWREPEPAADGQPELTVAPHPDPDGRSDADLVMTPEEVHWRSRLGTYLPRTIFPADRAELLCAARDSRAPDDVLAELGQLPPAVTFDNAAKVWAALGHPMDQRF